MAPCSVTRGDSCLILAMPHTGTWLPTELRERLNEVGHALTDTDWHIEELYDGLVPDATVIRANFHRYVIDANRDPSGQSLYPGQNTTGLCPLTDFDGRPIYCDAMEPDQAEIVRRLRDYHEPYHAAIAAEIDRIRRKQGVAMLYDCHSIRCRIPFLFSGVLPDFNIGTNGGVTCDPAMESAVASICGRASGCSFVLNGRFKGGWTTRHYGRPKQNIHAIQMELAQSAYLETEAAPFALSQSKAERIRPHLRQILETLVALARQH